MILYTKNDSSLNIPVGLGPSIGPLDASLVPLEVDSSTVAQSIMPTGDGFSSVTVNPYTLDSKTVDSSTVSQIITSDEDGLSSVTVNPVNASIDSDIQPGNIREGVEILGVEGTFQGGTLQAKTVDSSLSIQTITPDAGNYGLSSVTVNPYTTEQMTLDVSQNGLYTLIPQNADALSGVDISVNVQNNFNWIIEARKGNITDVSNYSLEGLPNIENGAAGILMGAPITTLPQFGTNNVRNYGLKYAFANTSVGPHVDISLDTLSGNEGFAYAFMDCPNITDVSINVQNIQANNPFSYAFAGCSRLSNVDISVGSYNNIDTLGSSMFYSAATSASVERLRVRFNNLETPSQIHPLYANNLFSGLFSYFDKPLEVEIDANKSLHNPFNLSGNNNFYHAFVGSNIRHAPNIIDDRIFFLTGIANFYDAFAYTQLEEINFGIDRLSYTSGGTSDNFTNTFGGCPNLTTVNLTGQFLSEENCGDNFLNTFSGSPVTTVNIASYRGTYPLLYARAGWNVLSSATTLENLNIGRVNSEVHLDWQPNLSKDSVISILSKADDYIGLGAKTITFYSGGLTFTDDAQGSLQAAYDSAVQHGWTINNLTIIPATGLIVLTSPSTISMDMSGDTAQITFDAYDTWGAEATIGGGTFPDFSVSPAYGSSGSQTITVTKNFTPIPHLDDGIITISSGSYSVNVTVSFT